MKGQLSIDLLLAMIAGAVFFSAISAVYVPGFLSGVSSENLQNEAKTILADAYAAIGKVSASPASTITTTSISYLSPMPPQGKYDSCKISKTANGPTDYSLTVTIIKGAETETATYSGINLSAIKFNADALTEFNCGEKITVSR